MLHRVDLIRHCNRGLRKRAQEAPLERRILDSQTGLGPLGLICRVKGQSPRTWGSDRVRPGDVGKSFNHLQPHFLHLSKGVMTPALPTSS